MTEPGPVDFPRRGSPRHRRYGPTRRKVAAEHALRRLLALPVLMIGLGSAATGTATALAVEGAAVSELEAALALSAVQPAVARAGQDVRLTVAVLNTGTDPLPRATVTALLDGSRIASRADVATWATATSSSSAARIVAESSVAPIPPAQQRTVTLTIPSDRITGPRPYAALPIALVLRAAGGSLARLHTFLPWQRVKEYRPLSIAFAVPLTLDADPRLFGPDSAQRTDAWVEAVGLTSRLQDVVDATADAPVTWAIDPAIFGPTDTPTDTGAAGDGGPTPAATTDGPSQPSPSLQPTAGTTTSPTGGGDQPDEVDQAVDGLVQRLSRVADRHTIWRLPYSDPDLAAVLATAPGSPVLPTVIGRRVDLSSLLDARVTGGSFAWPVSGPVTAAREVWLRQVFAADALTAAVTSVTQLASVPGYTGDAARRTADGLPLLAADDELSRLFALAGGSARPDPAQSVASATQRFLADSLALLDERAGTDRRVLITTERTFAPDAAAVRALFSAIAAAPWLQPVGTGDLLKEALTAEPEPMPAKPPTTTIPASDVADSPLSRRRVEGIPRTVRQVAGVAQILPDGGEFERAWTEAQSQLLSARWRGEPAAWRTVDTGTKAAVALVSGGVRVEPRTINFFADEGLIQLTAVNTLDVAVHDVRLRLTVPGAQANRLRVEGQPEPLHIGPNSRTTVRQQVTATASGRVTLVATLSAPNGTPLGTPTEVALRVQPTATWVFWVLGAVTGSFMALGVVRSLRGGRRAGVPPAMAAGAEAEKVGL